MGRTKVAVYAIIIAILITFFFVSSVFAGGWIQITTDSTLTPGQPSELQDPSEGTKGYWYENANIGEEAWDIPHSGLQTSTNQCKVCHAVHNSDNTGLGLGDGTTGTGNSFKLLRNGSRNTECYFCHGEAGALTQPIKKPYAPMLDGFNVIPAMGQHTLGATVIPDSTVDMTFLGTDGLRCGVCHSVHGGWTLNGVPNATDLSTKILRRDPAQNGNDANPTNAWNIGTGAAGGVINVQDQGSGNKAVLGTVPSGQLGEPQYLAAFCGDCHNKNVNWDRGGSGTTGQTINPPTVSEGERPNKFAHPNGKIDGLIDIYGKLLSVEPSPPNILSCDNCHASRGNLPSKFPHQSVGHKLLSNGYTDTSAALGDPNVNPNNNAYVGDPDRVLPNLDEQVCRGCHSTIGQPASSGSF